MKDPCKKASPVKWSVTIIQTEIMVVEEDVLFGTQDYFTKVFRNEGRPDDFIWIKWFGLN
jgi:hypothetical protein